jgi:hypothetical protein
MKRIGVISILLTLLAVPVAGQTVLPPAYQVVLDSNGDPVSGARVEVYQAGTVIAAPTYADAALATPNPWPIVADSAGRFVAFVPSGQSFKVIYKDAAGAVLKTVDGVAAIPSSTGNLDILGVAGEALLAGDVVYLSDGSGGLTAGKWYKADADNTYSSTLPTVGMVPAALAADATGTIRLAGKVENLSALVVGSTYYISARAGEMTAVAPANSRSLGSADTATSLILAIQLAAALTATVPPGAVTFFNLAACPAGWAEFTQARGLYIVGMPAAGTLAGSPAGQTALTNLENRAVGRHAHTATSVDAGHTHGIIYENWGVTNGGNPVSKLSGTGVADATESGKASITTTVNNAGTVAGTNAPYIQLLACVKQ